MGETFNLSVRDPVIVGIAIAPQRYSHRLISANREFVVNIPTVDILKQVDAVGSVSGRSVDKFAMTGLTAVPADGVAPPLIAECPVNIECRVVRVETIGDHDLFQGEALAQHVDPDVLDDEGNVDPARLRALAYQYGQYFAVGEYLGRRGLGADLLGGGR